MNKQSTATIKNISLRIPVGLYGKIETVNKARPHLSMNALIIEMLEERFSLYETGQTTLDGGTK